MRRSLKTKVTIKKISNTSAKLSIRKAIVSFKFSYYGKKKMEEYMFQSIQSQMHINLKQVPKQKGKMYIFQKSIMSVNRNLFTELNVTIVILLLNNFFLKSIKNLFFELMIISRKKPINFVSVTFVQHNFEK